jgi:SAM-dependent methyltransferase
MLVNVARNRHSPSTAVAAHLGSSSAPLRTKIPAPFELETLASLPRRELLDIGCGSGTTLKLGTLLGWKATGLELDLAAVLAARREGLDILHGSYRLLSDFPESFDCVVCSHVIEHVHDPQSLLRLMARTLKVGGVAIISCPNADSHVRHRFGASWRGLEAPRHLAIPSLDHLIRMLKDIGFSVITIEPIGSTTTKQSRNIHEERNAAVAADAKLLLPATFARSYVTAHPDFIQLVCRKLPQPCAIR